MWTIAGICFLIAVGLIYFFQPLHPDDDWVDEHHGYGSVEDSWDNLAGYRVGKFIAEEGKPSNIIPLWPRARAPKR